jgi:hypothetical protein
MDVTLPEAPHRAGVFHAGQGMHRTRRRLISWGLVALLGTLTALALAPSLVWHLPEPRPIRLAGLQGQLSGTYAVVPGGFLKLVPYADPLPRIPTYAPAISSRPRILVRARQLDVPQAYELVAWRGDRVIPVARSMRDGQTIELRPLAPLALGSYYVRAAADGADKDTNYFYFKVGSR